MLEEDVFEISINSFVLIRWTREESVEEIHYWLSPIIPDDLESVLDWQQSPQSSIQEQC